MSNSRDSFKSIKKTIISLVNDSGRASTVAMRRALIEEIGLDPSDFSLEVSTAHAFSVSFVSDIVSKYPPSAWDNLLEIIRESIPKKKVLIEDLRSKLIRLSSTEEIPNQISVCKTYHPFDNTRQKSDTFILSQGSLLERLELISNKEIRNMEERLWSAEDLWISFGFQKPANLDEYSSAREVYFAFQVQSLKDLTEQLSQIEDIQVFADNLERIKERSENLQSLVRDYPIFERYLDVESILIPIQSHVQTIIEYMCQVEIDSSIRGVPINSCFPSIRIAVQPLKRSLYMLKRQLLMLDGEILDDDLT